MYVHIGNNYILNSNNIIGIFNIENYNEIDLENTINNLVKKEDVLDISNGKKRTLIIYEEGKIKGFISNISSITIAKRIETKIIN